jgi:hypothetical protein
MNFGVFRSKESRAKEEFFQLFSNPFREIFRPFEITQPVVPSWYRDDAVVALALPVLSVLAHFDHAKHLAGQNHARIGDAACNTSASTGSPSAARVPGINPQS